MRVFVCINPFHGIDLAACFGELTHFFVCQNNTCIEPHPLVPFGASRLYEGSLHIGRAGREVKVSFTVLLLYHLLLVALTHSSHSHLKKSNSLMFAMPLLEQIRHILYRLNSLLCNSGLFRGSFVLFLRFIRRSQ